jgi:hypothetical protein
MALTLTDVLRAIYECEENCSLSSDWDGGWRVTIGGSRHLGFEAETRVCDPQEAAKWLHEQAIQRCEIYKARYGGRVTVGRRRDRE